MRAPHGHDRRCKYVRAVAHYTTTLQNTKDFPARCMPHMPRVRFTSAPSRHPPWDKTVSLSKLVKELLGKVLNYVLSIVTGFFFDKMQSCATYFLAAACAIKRAMKIGKVLRERPFLHFIWSDEYLTP